MFYAPVIRKLAVNNRLTVRGQSCEIFLSTQVVSYLVIKNMNILLANKKSCHEYNAVREWYESRKFIKTVPLCAPETNFQCQVYLSSKLMTNIAAVNTMLTIGTPTQAYLWTEDS